MTDEEVGKIWAQVNSGCQCFACLNQRALIVKLVEERARIFYVNSSADKSCAEYRNVISKDCENEALRDFGIDPATWPVRTGK